jgi:2-C-methyl-D-erythritol 2,4-cyclodiphosphate synthase
VGIGYDLHRLVPGRRLVLCGVEIPFEKGLDGHSDADVATHAVCDALLGAVAAGDIGQHFPPGDPKYKDISSLVLLERVVEIVRSRGFEVRFVDVVIVAEKPRLAPFVRQMRATLARVLGVPVDAMSVKATTTEGLGPEGRGDAMSARAVGVVGVRLNA